MRLLRAVREHLPRRSRHRAADAVRRPRMADRQDAHRLLLLLERVRTARPRLRRPVGAGRCPSSGRGLNKGNLCVRGRFGQGYVNAADRLLQPLVRDAAGELRAGYLGRSLAHRERG